MKRISNQRPSRWRNWFILLAMPLVSAWVTLVLAQAAPPAASPAPEPSTDVPALSPAVPAPAPAVSVPPVSADLPRDLTPWGMFLSADVVVKAVLIGLVFASVVTWTVWLAKSTELIAA